MTIPLLVPSIGNLPLPCPHPVDGIGHAHHGHSLSQAQLLLGHNGLEHNGGGGCEGKDQQKAEEGAGDGTADVLVVMQPREALYKRVNVHLATADADAR